MDSGNLALMIPILALLIPLVAILTGHRRKVEEIRAQAAAENGVQSNAQTERLEERVRVLERILTDRGTSLAHEIESLRAEDAAHAVGSKIR